MSVTTPAAVEELAEASPRGGAHRLLRRFLTNKGAVLALAVLAVIVLSALLAPWISPYDPDAQSLGARNLGPSGDHWLGTDAFGRDVLSRLMHAGRVSLTAGLLAVLFAAGIGVPLGLLAGYVGGRLDALLSRLVDAMMAVPNMVLVFAIVGVLGPGLSQAMIAFGLVSSPIFYRLCRAVSSDLRSETFVLASRAIGCSRTRIMASHILPNTMAALLVQISFMIGLAIVGEASLSFLGLGVQIPEASWGSMVKEAFEAIYSNQWLIVPPALAITVTILCFSLIGDGLRDALGRNQGGKE
ncbi:ABC transporter permease [Nocardioides marmotae]|uniref:ABC transporter permease subunit n=1 Tax=Nocardioides marmotae TaxID=2663857 RepID=A0A6I3J481_9ACTN|nr:ABC transporter permease [Nocardioides marmotae]MCR6030260.1 ABC transporter permease subunit [Gordonia jinghuaiqii]MBC9734449.1 ABC transporter permease [Nocardioides marmotae]MTB85549.1 ABC transporter permease subunit [Nocardioides marmotae]MTB93892.1 ABC transporter permease subunit [Nocardioides marmotae]QKE00214.1 ABC transporter permease [Nocardioides marmotae]